MEALAALMRQQMEQQRLVMEALQSMVKTHTLPKRTENPVTPVAAKNAAKKRQVQDYGTRSAQKLATQATPESKQKCRQLRTPKEEEIPRTPKANDGQKLKRTLSYEQAFRAGKRQQKSFKERMLRKVLAGRLAQLEPALMRGEFHIDDKFDSDHFFQEVAPIVYSVTGAPDSCSDEELPGKCMIMAKDIMRRRRRYLKKKKKPDSCSDVQQKPAKSSNVQQQPAKKRMRKRYIMQHNDFENFTIDDVDSLFETDKQQETLSYNCSSCNKSLKLPECYPEKSRHAPQKSQLFCKKCFAINNAILDSVDMSSKKDKQAKRALKPKSKSSKKKVTKAKKSGPKFKVSDYVMAQYPGYGNKWFKAEIYAKYRGKYNVYFLEDNSTLTNVEEKALKKAGTQQTWTKLKRVDFLKKPFEKKNEKWHAVKVGKGYRQNKYGCKMLDKPASAKLVWLPVSEVQQLIRSSS